MRVLSDLSHPNRADPTIPPKILQVIGELVLRRAHYEPAYSLMPRASIQASFWESLAASLVGR